MTTHKQTTKSYDNSQTRQQKVMTTQRQTTKSYDNSTTDNKKL